MSFMDMPMKDEGQPPDQNQKDEQKIVVRNLQEDIDDRELQANFMHYGDIVDIKLLKDSARGKAIAFVEYADCYQAKKARQEMMGVSIGGQMIQIEIALQGDYEREQQNIY